MSGVYIRSLANDLGQKLCCGGILKSLLRTQVGSFNLKEAILLPDLS
jgi:tRNA pseudouridine55 synthase